MNGKEEHTEPLLHSLNDGADFPDPEDQTRNPPLSKGKRVLFTSACLYLAGSLILLFSAVLLRNRPQNVISQNAQLVYCQFSDHCGEQSADRN